MENSYSLAELAAILGAALKGDPKCKIYGLAPLARAKVGEISFLLDSRYQLVSGSRFQKFLKNTQASAVILSSHFLSDCPVDALVMENPYQGYVQLAQLFGRKEAINPGLHPSVVCGNQCQIAPTASIGPNCVLGDNIIVGEHSRIDANTVIGNDCIIGNEVHIFPNVTLYDQVKLGHRVIIKSGAVIGGQGFGMYRDSQGWKKIPHLGGVEIGDDSEVGSNTTIDRGSLDDTVIGKGVKLDNLIQVAHNVVIDDNTVVAGCVGIAGSTKIGKNCMIGGAVGINDNIEITDNVIFTAMSQVTKSIKKPGVYSSGTGILPHKTWQKNVVRFHKLDELVKKIGKLETSQDE